MREELCLCAIIPKMDLATKVIFISTKREIQIPTNTARLAHLALINSALLVRGDHTKEFDLSQHLPRHGSHLLIYPDPDAELLTPELLDAFETPITLVFPDGNWRQTSKMKRRDPHLSQMRIARIAPGQSSKYLVRKDTKKEGLATIEAVARALGVVEGSDVQKSLEDLLAAMTSRVMKSRGIK